MITYPYKILPLRGGATWNPGSNSTNVSGNSGWAFTHNTRTIANGGGNWSSASTWVEGVVPTAGDDVVATGTSGNVTIDAATSARSINLTNYTGTLTHAAAVTLQIGNGTEAPSDNALVFPAGMTYTLGDSATSAINFVSTYATTAQNINPGGKTFGNTTFSGSTGTWKLTGNLLMGNTATLTLTSGIFDANGFNVTTGLFNSFNTNTRTLTMGSGTWTLTGNNGTIWTTATLTNLILNRGNPVIFNYSGSTGTRTITSGAGSGLESIATDFSVAAGSDTVQVFSPRNLDLTGFSGTLTNTTTTIYGNLTLSSGVTMTSGTSTMTFAATSGTKTITTNGKTLDFPVTFNGVGGTWQLQDNFTMGVTRTLTLTNGTLDANNRNVSVGLFSSSNANTRTVTMGSGTWTLSGTGTVWTTATATGLTLNPNTSTLVVSDITSTAKVFAGANTFNNFTLTAPTTVTFPSSVTTTFTGTFTATGSAGNTITINSSTPGTAATLSKASGTVSVNYVSLQDSTATGGATWNADGNSTSVSNNTGWNFGVGGGNTRTISPLGGNWNATTTWVEGIVPGASDNVVATSASGNVTITAAAAARSVDLTNYTGTLVHNATFTLSIGDATAGPSNVALKFPSTMSYILGSSSTSAISFVSTSTTAQAIDFGGKTAGNVTFNGVGGSWQLTSAFSAASAATLTLTNGTLDANNQNVTVGLFSSSNSNTRTLTMGSGAWTISSTGTVWSATTVTGFTLNQNTSTISITDISSTAKTFAGGGLVYNHISVAANGTGALTFSGSNTFNNFTINAPKTITFTSSTTQTISGTFTCTGSSGNLITIQSSSSGSAATLSKSSGTVSCDYLSVKDSAATGGAIWNAGSNSTSVSGNSGWSFAGSPGATRTISDAGGNWNDPAAWVEGIVPTINDDVVATSTSGNLTINGAASARSINLTNYTGTLLHIAGVTLSIGNGTAAPSNNALVFPTGMTYTLGNPSTSAISFVSTYATTPQQINFGGKTAGNVTFSGGTGTWKLTGNLLMGNTATLTFTSGTFDANGFNVTVGLFNSSNSNIRTLTMGSGTWTLTGNNAVIWNINSNGNLTINSGNPIIANYSGSVGSRSLTGQVSGTPIPDFNITAGSDSVGVFTSSIIGSMNFTGFSGIFSAGARTINGSLTLSSGMTVGAGTGVTTFGATSGTKTITTAGQTLDFPVTFNGVGGTWQLQDNMAVGASRAITVTNGTLQLNGKNITGGTSLTVSTGATLQLQGAETIGATTQTASSGSTILFTGNGDGLANTYTPASYFGNAYSNLTINSTDFATDIFQLGSATTIANNLSITAGTLTLPASSTITIPGAFSTAGSSGHLVVLNSSSSGTQATLSQSTGTVTASYTSIKDSNATGGATFNANDGTDTNVSGNSGWNFGGANTAPSITTGPSDGGSSASAPTIVGANVTFTATATDGESDQYYLAICKTNSITPNTSAAPTCSGGNWAISGATNSASQASVTYTALTANAGNNAWFAFACDNNASSLCSAVSQGSGNNGSPFVVVGVPTVTTQAVSSIAQTAATGNGTITAAGGENADKQGFVFSTTAQSDPGNTAPASSSYNPGVAETTGSFTTSAFTGSLTGLAASTQYFVRAYAHNSAGYSYGSEVTFTTLASSSDTTPPTVSAGSNVTASSQFTTAASASDAGGIATYQWSVTSNSGSGSLTFGSATSLNTTITTTTAATYVVRLTVTDTSSNSAFSEFTLTWTAPVSSGGGGGGSGSSFGGGSSTGFCTGASCAVNGSLSMGLPLGCTTTTGFSPLTGVPCSPGNTAPITTPTTPTPATAAFLRYLGPGDHGPDVLKLQLLLTKLKFFPSTVKPNGQYGPTTTASVKRFQKAHKISQTGNVGPLTLKALNSL